MRQSRIAAEKSRPTPMKFTYLITILFVFCSVDLARGQSPRTPEAFMDRGIERQAKGDLDGAIEDFTRTISLKPQALVLAAAYNNRANALTSKKDFAGAISDYIKDYSTALDIAPRFTDAYVNRGQAKQSKHDLDGAIADYNAALELKADDPGIYFARGSARQEKKDLNGALADYSKVIELDPSSAQAFANRAVIERLQGNRARADQDFDKAFKLDPSLKSQFKECVEKLRP